MSLRGVALRRHDEAIFCFVLFTQISFRNLGAQSALPEASYADGHIRRLWHMSYAYEYSRATT